MPSFTVLDETNGREYRFQPLHERDGVRHLSPDLGGFGYDVLAAMGTCGDPTQPGYESHREKTLLPILSGYGVTRQDVANPEKAVWRPEDALLESIWFARSRVATITVTNQTPGAAGVAESGFGVCGAVLRGQQVFINISLTDETPRSTRVARILALEALRSAAERYPIAFSVCDSVEQLAHSAGVAMKAVLAQRASGVRPRVEYAIPKETTSLEPAIYLSGTSGESMPAWINYLRGHLGSLLGTTNQIAHSWLPPEVWDSDPEASARAESADKLNKAVQLIAITHETDGLGALAELGPRFLMAHMAGQAFGIYIERHPSELNSTTNRTRLLVVEHLQRLREDFPNLRFFVTNDLKKLALYGASELMQFQARSGGPAVLL